MASDKVIFMNRSEELAKNTIILSIGTFLPKLVSFITLPILTGYLTKEEYGTYDLVTILVSLLLPSVTLQIKAAAFRYLVDVRGEKNKQDEIVTNIFFITIPISVVSLMILFFVLGHVDPSIKIWICLYYFFDILVGTTRQVARGLSYNFYYAISAIVSALGKMVFAVIFVKILGYGLYGAVISLCFASLISMIYLSFRIKIWSFNKIGLINRSTMRELISYSWPLVPNELSQWVMRVSDRLVVTAFMGIEANAVYAVANKIPSIITLAQGTLTLAWQENASIVSKDDDAGQYYSQMFHVMTRIQSGFLCLVLGVTPILFKILIRGDYQEAYNQMPVLCLAIFYASMATYLGGIYVAYKASKSVGITTTIAAVVNLVTDIGTIRWIGLYAASGSTLISYLLLCIYRMIDVQKLIKVAYNWNIILLSHLAMAPVIVLYYKAGLIWKVFNLVLGMGMFLLLNKDLITAIIKRLISVIKK